jgi:hypothetical protein
MGQFVNQRRFDERTYGKTASALEAASRSDHDTGWIPRPASNAVPINFMTTPRSVEIHESDFPDGRTWNHQTATSAGNTSIAFGNATKGYIRVQAQK